MLRCSNDVVTGSGSAVPVNYRSLAEFRFHIRRFLRFSEEAARKAGLEPQQHQLLLAIKGLPPGSEPPSVSYLAERLQTRHHSVVELVDRMEQRGLVRRRRSGQDRRKVLVELTADGEQVLQALSIEHRAELEAEGPALLSALERLLRR